MAPEWGFGFNLRGIRSESQAEATANHIAEVLAEALGKDLEVSYWLEEPEPPES